MTTRGAQGAPADNGFLFFMGCYLEVNILNLRKIGKYSESSRGVIFPLLPQMKFLRKMLKIRLIDDIFIAGIDKAYASPNFPPGGFPA
jgi:hypothetical protein